MAASKQPHAPKPRPFQQPTHPLYRPKAPKLQSTGNFTPTSPTDPLFKQQWYLQNTGQTGGLAGIDLNVVDVWQEYTGQGVRVGILDDGLQYIHPDLKNNFDVTLAFDAAELDSDVAPGSFDHHGTAVAGIIAAEANQIGGVGVAPNAIISGLRIDFFGTFGTVDQDADALARMANFDVVNNSWGYAWSFADNFLEDSFVKHQAALQTAVQTGRGGLGTVVVFAGGNDRTLGGSANYHNLENSRFVAAVAALDHKGKHTTYSSPGANLLVSALGGEEEDGIVTTDRLGTPGYNLLATPEQPADYTDQFGGTSAAAPMVSGVVALMLEANPNLGYRDVQKILAYTARRTDPGNSSWLINGAKTWNGGGLHTSRDYGFGLVDAHAAVRLAETWTAQSTFANEQKLSAQRTVNRTVPEGKAGIKDSLTLAQSLNVEHVEVELEFTHAYPDELEFVLQSPSGTKSVLFSESGTDTSLFNPVLAAEYGLKSRFTFSSTQFWGEVSNGKWTLSVRDRAKLDVGVLKNWALHIYGDRNDNNDIYVYTDEFAKLTKPSRQTLTDSAGNDTLNAAAITTNLKLNLNPGATSSLGANLKIANATIIENAIGGDGNDVIQGNAAANSLNGKRGNDALYGAANKDSLDGDQGDDLLHGGMADDWLVGGNGADQFMFGNSQDFRTADLGIDTVVDFISGLDKILLDKKTFAALTSRAGVGFSKVREFASVATDQIAAKSNALIVYSRATGGLFYNPNSHNDGFGAGAKFALLSSKPGLSGTDFVLRG